MARQIEFVKVTLQIERDARGNLVKSVDTIRYSVSDPAMARKYDQSAKTGTGLPGFALDPVKRDAVLDDVLAAVKTETSVP